MSHYLRAACGALLITLCATPAGALEGDRTAPFRAAAPLPSMNAVRTFTVIPASTAPADLAALRTYFAAFGFGVTTSPVLKNLTLTGTLAQAAAATRATFSVGTAHGDAFLRATPFAFPPSIAKLIRATSFVPGAHAQPLFVKPKLATNGSSNGYGPADIAALYDLAPVYARGLTGAQQTVAVASCSSISGSDLSAYDALYGLPAADLEVIPIDGATTFQDGEAILDVERVHGTAPGASIRLYLAPDCTFGEIIDLFTRIAEDDTRYHFAAVSHSYGFDEGDYAADGLGQSLLDESAALAQIAGQHTPIFAASGDNGSWNDLGIENATDVGFPASDPSVIAVGGTTVENGTLGNRLFEHAWTGSGGGVSGIFATPTYQMSTPGIASGIFKNVPDVSMLADPFTGATEVFAFGGGTFPIGGTSVSAPTFAGVWTLVAEARANAHHKPLQSVAAALYSHAATFTDITAGDNGYYIAKPGYDNVTGLGVPDAAKLVDALK